MSTYEPVHNPDVHGHAYTVRYQGQHTQPFAAVEEDVPAPPASPRQYDQPCPYGCPVFPPAPLGESRVLLYAGPGITDRTWQARVREGAWDDIPSEFDAAHARVHLPANKRNRHIHRDLSNSRHHLAAAFDAHPDWRTDADLAEGLHRMEAELAAGLNSAAESRRAEEEERWAAA